MPLSFIGTARTHPDMGGRASLPARQMVIDTPGGQGRPPSHSIGLPLIAVCLLLLCGATRAERPDVVLITIDTLRADHLGCYGYRSGLTPTLDQLAKEGIRFTSAFSAVPLTLPSHTTILTGLYPNKHGVRDNAAFPPIPDKTLPEILKHSGYLTAAFVSGAPLLASFGVNRGFDVYDDDFVGQERKADLTTDRAIQWFKTASRPFFLWVHYFDPHAPYDPPDQFKQDSLAARPYDGEIAFVDQQLSRLLSALPKSCFVIITADHGESLGEHGESTHGVFLYNATLRVPLILKGPGWKPAVRSEPVSLVDLAPTIAELARATLPLTEGASLLSTKPERTLFSESLYAQRNFGYAPLFAALRHGKKFIQAPRSEFFNLQSDPLELKNIAPPADLKEWQKALLLYAKSSTPVPETRPVSEEEAEKLRSLGYISASLPAGTIDPKDRVAFIENFNAAMKLLETKQYPEAERAFRSVVTGEKHNALGFRFLGDALAAQHKYLEATNALETSLTLMNDPQTALQLARCYYRMGDATKARGLLLDTISHFPGYSEAVFELASLFAAEKNRDAAFAVLNSDTPEVHNQRGILYLQQKQVPEATAEFEKAAASHSKAAYWNNLGIAYQQMGKREGAERAFENGLEMNSGYTECEANLAFLLVAEQRWQEALTHLQHVAVQNDRLWNVRFALGMSLENLQRKEEAATAYQKLLDDAPTTWPTRPQVEEHLRLLQRGM
jgi:arylsulfatase A-like enzyme/tetratricopeptide (TPR) repeat protein